jgi:hypothetical protein
MKTLVGSHAHISSVMLVKVNSIDTDKNKVKVTHLDIDEELYISTYISIG